MSSLICLNITVVLGAAFMTSCARVPVQFLVLREILAVNIHQLDHKVHTFTRRIRHRFAQNLLFAKEGDFILHDQFNGSAGGVPQHRATGNDPFIGFQ